MCGNLLQRKRLVKRATERKAIANAMAMRFSAYPLWLTLGVYLYEKHANLATLPKKADDLAENYWNEVVEGLPAQNREVAVQLLGWIALLGTVNREDQSTVRVIAELLSTGETHVLEILANLVRRRALHQRGVRQRLVEIKPEVLRDHLLVHGLSADVGFGMQRIRPSEHAQTLAVFLGHTLGSGTYNAHLHSVLLSVARTEQILNLSGETVPLLDPFFAEAERQIENAPAGKRHLFINILPDIALFRPESTLQLIDVLRHTVAVSETVEMLLGPREIGHDDVILELAWPTYGVAIAAKNRGVRLRVLRTLLDLCQTEAEILARRGTPLPNDGRRAAQLLAQVVSGDPQLTTGFDDEIKEVAEEALEDRGNALQAMTKGYSDALVVLLGSSTELERIHTWFKGYAVHTGKCVVLPNSPAWQTREAIKHKIKKTISSATIPSEDRLVLWDILAKGHSSANRVFHTRGDMSSEVKWQVRRELLRDLIWTYVALTRRLADVQELEAARKMWAWYLEFDKDSVLKHFAQILEALYMDNQTVAEFTLLLARDNWNERGERFATKACELADAGARGLRDFLQRAGTYFRAEQGLRQIMPIARLLGSHASAREWIPGFIEEMLTESAVAHPYVEFGLAMASGWLSNPTPDLETCTVIERWLQLCADDMRRMALLAAIFRPPRAPLRPSEHVLLRSSSAVFVTHGRVSEYMGLVAWTADFEWTDFKTLIESLLAVEGSQLEEAVAQLVDGIYGSVCVNGVPSPCSSLVVWLLDQVNRVPDLDNIVDLDWKLDAICHKIGRAPIDWLPSALERRVESQARSDDEYVEVASEHSRLSRYVASITKETTDNSAARDAVNALVLLGQRSGVVSYYLPTILKDVDPDGYLVPSMVAKKIRKLTGRDDVWRLARISGAYAMNSMPWREIASPVVSFALTFPSDLNQQAIFSALVDQGPRSWTSAPGETPPILVSTIESAQQFLDTETYENFKPFWRWYVEHTKSTLRQWEEVIDEERGN